MNNLSRRTFIGGAAAGVAAAAVATVPGLAVVASSPPDDADTSDLLGPVVARVRDLHTGEITLYAGTEEISYTDPVLARRLTRAAAH